MSIMRTKGTFTITGPPVGKKITIENFDKDLNTSIFYGWDVISADETEDSYLFQLRNRTDNKLRVYITLGRESQYAQVPYYPEKMYQCYVHDDGTWNDTSWFRVHDITYKNFWGIVEEIVDKYQPTPLPF